MFESIRRYYVDVLFFFAVGTFSSLIIAFVLLQADYSQALWRVISQGIAGVVLGWIFVFIGRPLRFTTLALRPVDRWERRHNRRFYNWVTAFGPLYGGLVFYAAARIGEGQVFGVTFDAAEGNIYAITAAGLFFGLLLCIGHLADVGLSRGGTNGVVTVITVLILFGAGTIFALVEGMLFVACALVTCVVGATLLSSTEERWVVSAGSLLLPSALVLLPITAYTASL